MRGFKTDPEVLIFGQGGFTHFHLPLHAVRVGHSFRTRLVVRVVHNINEERKDINNTIHLLPQIGAVTISTRNIVRPLL